MQLQVHTFVISLDFKKIFSYFCRFFIHLIFFCGNFAVAVANSYFVSQQSQLKIVSQAWTEYGNNSDVCLIDKETSCITVVRNNLKKIRILKVGTKSDLLDFAFARNSGMSRHYILYNYCRFNNF